MEVTVIGLGYIGLPTAALIASKKIQVYGFDINEVVITKIREGITDELEPGLSDLVEESLSSGFLKVSTKFVPSDIYLITVPTPVNDSKEPDMSYVYSACEIIKPFIKKGDLIILESTSPVGTSEKIIETLRDSSKDLSFGSNDINNKPDVNFAYCPERVLPGNIIEELKNNDRIIGGITEFCSFRAEEFYRCFTCSDYHKTNARTAELTKLIENSYRDVNLAFANEISVIAEDLEIDPWELINLANQHPRVDILSPSAGVGGHCIPVDPWFVVFSSPKNSLLINQARTINDKKPQLVVEDIREEVDKCREEELIPAVFGLSYKSDSNDLRESPALFIAEKLTLFDEFKTLYIVEPNITELPPSLNREKVRFTSVSEALEGANFLIFLVNHKTFKEISVEDLKEKKIKDVIGLFPQPVSKS